MSSPNGKSHAFLFFCCCCSLQCFHLQLPDVGAELTGGCYGFATRYNHWPEQLVVGGVSKNDSGYITR